MMMIKKKKNKEGDQEFEDKGKNEEGENKEKKMMKNKEEHIPYYFEQTLKMESVYSW